jgi:Polyketide cyclase / dehydrase and lipid transport
VKVYDCARVDVEICAAVSVVWRLLADVERWPDWTPTVLSASRTDSGPLAIGASYRIRQPQLPERIYTVTALKDQAELTWETRATGLRMVASHEVWPTHSGSCAQLVFSVMGVLTPMVRMLFARKIDGMVRLEADSLRRAAELQ